MKIMIFWTALDGMTAGVPSGKHLVVPSGKHLIYDGTNARTGKGKDEPVTK